MTRRRFIYDADGNSFEVGGDYQPTPREHHRVVGDSHYDGLYTVDGVNISSRQKHRDYMKRHGLTTTDDFRQTWHDQEKHRMAVRAGQDRTRQAQIREAISKLNR